MLKKAGVVAAAAAAGLLMLGAPAFAGDGHDGINNAKNGQVGLVNLNDIDIIKDINVNTVVGACGNNVGGLIGAAVPILSPSITGVCAAGGIDD